MDFEMLVKSAPSAVLVSRADGRTCFANAAAERLFGRALACSQLSDLLLEEGEAPGHEGTWRRAVGSTPEGAYLPLALLRFDYEEGGQTLTARLIRPLQPRETDEDAEAEADFERLLRAASHDLQEPLRMIAAFADLLRRRYHDKLDADAVEFLGFAADGARRMQRMVDDLLAHARVRSEPVRIELCDASVCALEAIEALDAEIAESSADIRVEPLPCLHADPTLMTLLFRNLLSNSIRFRTRDAPAIRVSASKEADAWRIAVEDNGIGIEPRFRERIFEPFQRLHPIGAYPGSGLGLATSREIVRRHGGRIWADAAEGGGSRFQFTMPRSIPLRCEDVAAGARP